MRIRILLFVLFLLSVAAFVTINWQVFIVPTTLGLLLTTVDAPIGLVMLALLALVVLAFTAHAVIRQGTTLLETRRQTKELQALRALAEQAEASRLAELRAMMRDDVERLSGQIEQARDALKAEVRDSTNSLAATIGEIDDRLQRACKRDTPG